jgi:hypothetical protein
MRLTISIAAALAVCAYANPALAQTAPADTMKPAATPAAAPAAVPEPFQIDGTSWAFTGKDGVKVQESIDAAGNFIAQSDAGKHLDHGTAVMKGDKACFTSAMTKEGEVCWTTKPLKVGESFDTTSDKGDKLTVTRVAYHALEMPK